MSRHDPDTAATPADLRLTRYTVDEACALLKISRCGLYLRMAEGRLRYVQDRGRRFIPGSEIARLCAAPTTP